MTSSSASGESKKASKACRPPVKPARAHLDVHRAGLDAIEGEGALQVRHGQARKERVADLVVVAGNQDDEQRSAGGRRR